jgi:hypothetical protein
MASSGGFILMCVIIGVLVCCCLACVWVCFLSGDEEEEIDEDGEDMDGHALDGNEALYNEGSQYIETYVSQLYDMLKDCGCEMESCTDGGFERWTEQLSGMGKITAGFSQIVGTFEVNFDVEWPPELLNLFEQLSMINLDFYEAFSVACASESITFYDKFFFTVSYPLVLLLVCWLVKFVRCCCAEDDYDVQNQIAVQHWKFSLFTAFIIYPSTSATVLRMFSFNRDLQQGGVGDYMMADYRLQMDDTWNTNAIIGAAAVLVYPIGIPVTFYYMLWKNQQRIYDDSQGNRQEYAQARVGFICQSYTKDAWYWEIVVILQKLMLTGAIIFFHPGTTLQLAAAFCIAFTFLVSDAVVQPFVNSAEGRLQRTANISMVLTIFGGILLKTKAASEGSAMEQTVISYLMIAINACVFIAFVIQAVGGPNSLQYKEIAENKVRSFILVMMAQNRTKADPYEERITGRLLIWIEAMIDDFLFEEDDQGEPVMSDKDVTDFTKMTAKVSACVGRDPENALEYVGSLARRMMKDGDLWNLLDSCGPTDLAGKDALASRLGFPTSTTPSQPPGYHVSGKLPTMGVQSDGIEMVIDPIQAEPVSGDRAEWLEEKKQVAYKVFARYDLDLSNTVNSWEELSQMTTNIIFKLGYKVAPEDEEAKLEDLQGIEANPMTFEEFWEVFLQKFGPPPGDQ